MREMADRRRGPEACAVSTYAPRAGGLIQARLPLVFGLKPPMGDLMTRTLAIRRSALGVTVGLLLAAMTLAAAALAAKPAHGAHFTGRTAAAPILGFYAPVRFTVSQNGRQLTGFSYGSFGCFGAGGFRPGVNPYTGGSMIHVGAVRVSASGSISVSGAKSTSSAFGNTTVTTISVTGRFTKAKAATGKITFSQKISGKFNSTCGPAQIGFSASAR
jgi:hypothetical protein